jgi:hypothetical protein
MEIAVKMAEMISKGRGRWRGGGGGGAGISPAAGIMGERRPLAPSFMASWELSPMEMGSMGEAKTWLWWLQIRGWRCPSRARVPPFPSPHLGPH